jgi:hypothetical protein
MNTYKKLNSGSYGAWIDTGYGRTAVAKPKAGDTVTVTTKSGEQHNRIVKKIVQDFKSGCIVSLQDDAAIASQAQARYNSINDNAQVKKSELTNAQRARIYDNVINEGGEGYNPYRNNYSTPQNVECAD